MPYWQFWGIEPDFQVMKVCCSFTEGMMAEMMTVPWKSRSAYRRTIIISDISSKRSEIPDLQGIFYLNVMFLLYPAKMVGSWVRGYYWCAN